MTPSIRTCEVSAWWRPTRRRCVWIQRHPKSCGVVRGHHIDCLPIPSWCAGLHGNSQTAGERSTWCQWELWLLGPTALHALGSTACRSCWGRCRERHTAGTFGRCHNDQCALGRAEVCGPLSPCDPLREPRDSQVQREKELQPLCACRAQAAWTWNVGFRIHCRSATGQES